MSTTKKNVTKKKAAPAVKKSTPVEKSSTPVEETRYFNEFGKGLGYVNGVREYNAEGKPTRYSAQISVLQGPENKVHYEYHDLTISSKYVLDVILEHQEAIKTKGTNVLIRFNMINPRANAFIYPSGERKGEIGSSIGGFLSRILSMKIDGKLVFEDKRTFDDPQDAIPSGDDIPF